MYHIYMNEIGTSHASKVNILGLSSKTTLYGEGGLSNFALFTQHHTMFAEVCKLISPRPTLLGQKLSRLHGYKQGRDGTSCPVHPESFIQGSGSIV
jgi:hypothetical protein